MLPLDTLSDEPALACLKRHCRMYLYASSGSPEIVVNEVAHDFFVFGLLHLTSTMFIVTDRDDRSTQGLFHKVLDPLKQSHLLADVDRILDRPIGGTSLRKYIQSKRNTLATHGTARFSSQPEEVQDVTCDADSLAEYEAAMTELDAAVLKLYQQLEALEQSSERSSA